MSRARLLVLVMLLAYCPALFGQTTFGSIVGTVSDASGGAVPGAEVTLTRSATSETRTATADSAGGYVFVNLIPGSYRIDVEVKGFKHFTRQPIVVEVNQSTRIDVPLVVGQITQTVEVTAQTPLLQSQTSDLGQVVGSRTVSQLPLNGRNPIALVQLAPGVVPQGPPSAGNSSLSNPVGANPFGAGDFQIGGGQAGQNAILLDGVPTNGSYLNVVTVIPTQDSLQEFKIQTNNMGPEFGRFAGGVINFATKSGSNEWHGAAYEYLRNKVLDANDFFLNKAGVPIGPWTQNQFGANVGGKIIRDKLFVFGSYEGYRRRSSSAFTSTVPTDAMKNGDFTGLASVYDPTTSATCASGGGTCRTQIGLEPGGSGTPNVLAPGQISATSKAFLGYFPEPNGPGTPSTSGPLNNYTTSYSTGGNTSEVVERTDYNLSDKQRIFGRFSYYNLLNLPDSPFKDICTDRCTETVHSKQIALGDTYSFSPTTILDLHLGYTRYVYVRTPLTTGFDFSTLGGAWSGYQFASTPLPVVCISQNPGDNQFGGGWCSAGTGSEIGAHDDTWSFTPSLTKIKGRHTIKAGYEGRLLRNNYYQSNQPSGNFAFDDGMTAANPLASPITTGNGFASFLLGYGSKSNNGGAVVTPSFMATQMWYNSWYAGDTFRATSKLTLNLGLRYELQGFFTERFNRIVNYQPNLASPLAGMTNPNNGLIIPSGLKGAFALVATPASPDRTAERMPWTDLNPRLGVAYRLRDNTVIRAGYGIFFLPNDVRWNDAPHNLFINTYSQAWLATVNNAGVLPLNTFSNPFPSGIVQPPGRNQTFINAQANGPSAPVFTNPQGYAQQWNFDIQHDFHDGTLVDVAYAGAKGTHLPMHSQDLDQLPDSLLPTSAAGAAALNAAVPNPYYGIVQGNLTGATVPAGQLLMPFPQYSDVSMAEPDNRDSMYESAQFKVQKRMKGGGIVLASYTISKLISDTNNEINWLGDAAPNWGDVDAYNLHNERSLDGFDVPQRFVASYVLDLPVGRGKKFGNNLSPVANGLVSGWGINGIITLQSGFPLNIGGASDNLCNSVSGVQIGGCRAERTGTAHLTSGSLNDQLNKWFTTSVFTSTSSNDWTRGNDSRTEPNIRQDGQGNFDFAAFKNTQFGPDGRLGLEFRAEFFNIFNHPQFSAPNTSVTSGAFGQVTSQYNLPRIIQFGLKFTF